MAILQFVLVLLCGMSEQQQVYWNPDAQVNISGAEFGAFSQILDLVVAPLGSYSLGDLMTLVAMAQEARNQVIKRLQESNQIFSEPVTQEVVLPTPDVTERTQSEISELKVASEYEEATQEFGFEVFKNEALTKEVQEPEQLNEQSEKGFLI